MKYKDSLIDYKNYHRDKTYLENESHFKNIFMTRYKVAECFFDKNDKKQMKVLDIGAANGVMLDIFKENKWETWGVEPSETGKIAKQKGHKIFRNYFEKIRFPKNYFDLVIMNHTLEHVNNPEKVLAKVFTLLKSEGVLLVDVPNAGGLAAKILQDKWPYRLPDEHISQFTKKSLSKLFQKSGFEIIHFESRSGIFEFGDPFKEICEALMQKKKRFFTNLINIPYDILVTFFDVGDSMTLVGRKK